MDSFNQTYVGSMDSFNQTYVGFISFSVFAIFLFYIIQWNRKKSRKAKAPPEPAGAWPLVGHLPLLSVPNLAYLELSDWADKYGPAFCVKLGLQKVLVVSSWEVAKECFTVNDKVFVSRPSSVAAKIMGYNYALFGFGPYCSYWREARKMTVLHLLSNHSIDLLKQVRASEVSNSIKELYKFWERNASNVSGKALVEMRQWSTEVTTNLMARMIGGKQYLKPNAKSEDGEGKRLQMAIHKFFYLVGIFVMSDALPFLSWLDIGGHEKAMRRNARELDSIMSGWLDEHKQNKLAGVTNGDQDFMDILMSKLENIDLHGFEPDVAIKGICLNMVLGGTDTIAVTITWALSLLLNNRHVMKKAQEEIDSNVGKDRQVNESDLEKLPFVQAIVKETLRFYPASPLTAQHEAIEDCTVAGYHVPAGTRLITNLWKLHRDPSKWPNPCEFQPDRFLTTHANTDFKGQNFEFLPFGAGRRSCPGMSLGTQVVQYTLARLLQGFEFETPLNEAVDMTGSAGNTNRRATPLEVLITPRLPSNLY